MNTSLAYKEEYLKEELINGQVVLMSPQTSISHVKIIDNISTIFNIFLKGKTCQSFPDGVAVFLTEKDLFCAGFYGGCDPEKSKTTAFTARRIWWWKCFLHPQPSATALTKSRFTSNAGCGNIGWLARMKNRWSNICWIMTNWFAQRLCHLSRFSVGQNDRGGTRGSLKLPV